MCTMDISAKLFVCSSVIAVIEFALLGCSQLFHVFPPHRLLYPLPRLGQSVHLHEFLITPRREERDSFNTLSISDVKGLKVGKDVWLKADLCTSLFKGF